MVEVIGGALMMLGGAAQAASSYALVRAGRSPIQRAAERLGNTDDSLPPVPASMTSLLSQIDEASA